jgi:hypothetical protein
LANSRKTSATSLRFAMPVWLGLSSRRFLKLMVSHMSITTGPICLRWQSSTHG